MLSGLGLCMTVLGNLDGLPDFRLRAINKMLIKNFINKCPVPFFPSVMIPILKQVRFFLPVFIDGLLWLKATCSFMFIVT